MSHKVAKRQRRILRAKAKGLGLLMGNTRPERRRSLAFAIWQLQLRRNR